MTYAVECERISRDPNIAANELPLSVESRVFEYAQDAVNFAREWVRKSEDGDSIPRAFVRAVPDSKRRQSKAIFRADRGVKLVGEYREFRVSA